MGIRATHTYVIMELSAEAFEEIHAQMEAAGYQHQIDHKNGRVVIDMSGIAVASEAD